MTFGWSAELDADVLENFQRVAQFASEHIEIALASGDLADSDVHLRYVPIVMSAEEAGRYPERSQLVQAENVYDCSPQLSHQVYLSGESSEMFREYFRGLESAPAAVGKLTNDKKLEVCLEDALCKCLQICLSQTTARQEL